MRSIIERHNVSSQSWLISPRYSLYTSTSVRWRSRRLLRLLSRRFPARAGELLLTQQGAFAPRLRAVRPPAATVPCSYQRALVTGGLRGLGLRVAKWLADSGRAKALVLMGRRAAEGANAALLEELQAQLPVEVRLGDVGVWEEVEALPSCELVIHCAGAVKDGVLLKLSKEDVRKALNLAKPIDLK